MKKLLLLAGAVVLLAAACNSQRATNNQPNQTGQTAETSKVDEAVSVLNASVDNEDAINLESDDDVIYSDQTVINGYDGVSNATY